MSQFTSFLTSIWNLFESVFVPGLSLTFADLWIGVFVVSIGIVLLRPLLGIGASGVRDIFSSYGDVRQTRADRSSASRRHNFIYPKDPPKHSKSTSLVVVKR